MADLRQQVWLSCCCSDNTHLHRQFQSRRTHKGRSKLSQLVARHFCRLFVILDSACSGSLQWLQVLDDVLTSNVRLDSYVIGSSTALKSCQIVLLQIRSRESLTEQHRQQRLSSYMQFYAQNGRRCFRASCLSISVGKARHSKAISLAFLTVTSPIFLDPINSKNWLTEFIKLCRQVENADLVSAAVVVHNLQLKDGLP